MMNTIRHSQTIKNSEVLHQNELQYLNIQQHLKNFSFYIKSRLVHINIERRKAELWTDPVFDFLIVEPVE